MPGPQLSTDELAALDLVIDSMTEDRFGPGFHDAAWIGGVVKVTKKVVKKATPYTPAVVDAIGASAKDDPRVREFTELARGLPQDVSLEQLLALRHKATRPDAPAGPEGPAYRS